MKKTDSGQNFTDIERTFGSLLRKPYQIMVLRVYGQLAERGYSDIRPAHGAVFRHIAQDGSRITDLAERAQMTKQSMGYLVEYLQRGGYVEILPDPIDGRAKRVHLTESGLAVQITALELSRQIEQDIEDVIGKAEMHHLRTLIERVIKCLEKAQDS